MRGKGGDFAIMSSMVIAFYQHELGCRCRWRISTSGIGHYPHVFDLRSRVFATLSVAYDYVLTALGLIEMKFSHSAVHSK